MSTGAEIYLGDHEPKLSLHSAYVVSRIMTSDDGGMNILGSHSDIYFICSLRKVVYEAAF